jgi:glycosyltransferase involved in cell wall biosynthesis/SAM-dependent methyltransferase
MSRKFRFHMVTMPHVQVNKHWNACAYTQKDVKFVAAMAPRGHEIILYGNEGSDVGYGVEIVQLLTEEERSSWFGGHNKQKLYDLRWDSNEPYWRLQAERAIPALKARVRKGDFILSLSGCCHQPIADHFPGSYSGDPIGPMWVEYGSGYYGVFSKRVVYESETHRSWLHGRRDSRVGDFHDAVVPNYWDLSEFQFRREDVEPYFLFVGRIIEDKGWRVAVEVTKAIGAKLVLAGQGDPSSLPDHVTFIGHVDIPTRNRLMTNAIATFCPTTFREPFGGTAVETQLCGTPAITTDYGAFVETTLPEWRCATHREFVEAAKRAQSLIAEDRVAIKARASSLYSLEAAAVLYERYFSRILSVWWGGYYEMRDLATLELPPSEPVETTPAEPPPPPSDICDFAKITDEETPQATRIAQWMKAHHGEGRIILDVGCGPGIYVEEMRKLNLQAYGVDSDSRLVESGYLARFDITKPWEDFAKLHNTRAYPDITLSLEVGEHIPEAGAEAYVDFIAAGEPDLIYFSAAKPGQGGNGHINCQPKSYWVEKFYRVGYWLDVDATDEFIAWLQTGYHMGWLRINGMILRRA